MSHTLVLSKPSGSGSLSLCRYSYSPKYILSQYPSSPLLDPGNILHEPSIQRQLQRPRVGLWWSITANTMPAKNVIRSWAERRLKVAVQKALKRTGWDRWGRVVPREQLEDGEVERVLDDMKGTLHVHTFKQVLQATGEELQREADELIGIVERKVEGSRSTSKRSRMRNHT